MRLILAVDGGGCWGRMMFALLLRAMSGWRYATGFSIAVSIRPDSEECKLICGSLLRLGLSMEAR